VHNGFSTEIRVDRPAFDFRAAILGLKLVCASLRFSCYEGSRSRLRLDQVSIDLQTTMQAWGTPQPMRERRDRTSAGNPV
jgi:hypothetical protein